MSSTSCGPGGSCRARARRRPGHVAALLLATAFGFLVPGLGAAASQERDPVLREKLREALAEPVGFADRFEAQVWLMDMSGRLASRVPDPAERIEILTAVHREATRAHLPPEMVLAVIDVESGFQRFAVSRSNAQGLMQVMRFWLTELNMPGHALLSIQDNVRMGCTILRYYYDLERGNWNRALGRYNGSLGKREYPNLVFDRLQSRWYKQ
jgi:soluble lytic murein transglycosylase-like protein